MQHTFFIICFCLVFSATGQIDSDFIEQNYNFEAKEENDEVLLPPPLDDDNHRRFLDGLVIEAGRHLLFPELYSEEEQNSPRNTKGIKYFEKKGQPEFEESYLNRPPRVNNCPSNECTHYKPVCGTDGKVYASECHLVKENCGKNNVSSGHWLKCMGTHYLCPSRCLDLNEPVCGSDLRIYHNICLMRKRNCGKLLQKLPLTVCYERFSQESKECPDECIPIAKPACGSDGLIYFNECFLRMRTCKQGIVQVPMDNCLFIPKCPQVCLPFYDPVCGSDGNLYTNYCRMLQTNCGKQVKKMPSSFCQGST
ncbi:ovoinhibitor-like isoform X2 [Parasteatoda tepidariorum]|uniref:ovoinhibitor-like isoform X2 n=1 Tax=Parasteatoda tepidariorum TaxID=114398 RepID=UPI001C72365B|nr:agrin-like isoform X2 [Parasteatoda tepidariorum]